jgi:radical SAM/Cys-rich protein
MADFANQFRAKSFDEKVLAVEGDHLRAIDLETIQVNIGLTCNIECRHCHVVSGPLRTERMNWDTMEMVLAAARRAGSKRIDITGGAPEMNPEFRRFILAIRREGLEVMVRTNLTILLELGYEDLPEFFVEQRVHLVASLPCYLEENVDAQRGEGVYAGSIAALRILNQLGYGLRPELPLDLVYNPPGPALPPDQAALELDYKRRLEDRFGIRFNHLFTITNMPIGRFLGDLRGRCIP